MFIKLPIAVSLVDPEEAEKCYRLQIPVAEKSEIEMARINIKRIESYYPTYFNGGQSECVTIRTYSGDEFSVLMNMDEFEEKLIEFKSYEIR